MKLAAGIDIGGTNVKFGLVGRDGRCYGQEDLPTACFIRPEEMADEIWKRLKSSLPENASLTGIGIGAPNASHLTGSIENPPNLPWKGITPLRTIFENCTGLPCALANDANASALGEMLFGGAGGMKDFLFITLGTGVGSGIVTNGELLHGHDGFAAELGHVIIMENGRTCGCGRKGCLETYCSARGMERTVSEWLKQGKKSILLNNRSGITARSIYEAALQGDNIASDAFEFTGSLLGKALANSAAYTSPKAIFLSGGLAGAGKLLFEPTERHFEKNLFPVYRNKIRILPSGLKDNLAGILGAASLVWHQE